MKLTELEAINQMLLSIGLHPAAAVDDLDVYSEGMIARSILKISLMETLANNWHFNTHRLTLVPESDGTVVPPDNTLDVYCAPELSYELIVDSQGRLKDIKNDTTVFNGSVEVYVVRGYPWDEVPPNFQLLVLHKAQKQFMRRMKPKLDTRDIDFSIMQAEATCRSWDTRQRRYSMLDSLRSHQHVSTNWTRG